MNKRIQKLFPKEFYAKDDLKLYAEISLRNLNIIVDYIEKLENYGEAVGERRNQLYDKIDQAIEYIKETELYQVVYDDEGNYFNTYDDKATADLLQILGEKNDK